ncbi:MAG: Rid family hydrolase [Propionibacteriaceae bacterium]
MYGETGKGIWASGPPFLPHEPRGHAQRLTSALLSDIATVLKAAGFTLADVVRLNYYSTDVDRFLMEGAEVGDRRLGQAGCRPATTLLGGTRLAYPELLIEDRGDGGRLESGDARTRCPEFS